MQRLNQLLADVPELTLPAGHGPDHGSHLHVVRVDRARTGLSAAQFTAHLKEHYRVATAKHYPAVWTWEAFQALGYTGEGCPVAAEACEQVFSTPVFPTTTEEDLEYIAWALKQSLFDLLHGQA